MGKAVDICATCYATQSKSASKRNDRMGWNGPCTYCGGPTFQIDSDDRDEFIRAKRREQGFPDA